MNANDWTQEPMLRWIPMLPLLAALVHGLSIGVVRRAMPDTVVTLLSCGSVLGSFVISCVAFTDLVGLSGDAGILADTLYTWLGAGVGSSAFSADVSFRFDALSATMCLLVSGVAFLVHIYSVGYMEADERDDRGFQRFFGFLNLFVAAMLVLVLADNLLLMFLGWAGIGLCSYLLIGFWFTDTDNARAGANAFVFNRIGDVGFLIGILLLFTQLSEAGTPTLSFHGMEAALAKVADATLLLPVLLGGFELKLVDAVGLCLFVGACGKSAQIPLHVWLPDATAGPTPVSALIHTAAMVTAGVYMVCRLSFLYAEASLASAVIAWTGAVTAIFAATIAMAQNDIKKVLAYSTMSQLGYMFLAVGCGAYTAAMFHLVTHAFFNALLFLGIGAVLLSVHHEQDLMRLGGLGKRLPKTRLVMLIGVLSIAGMPGLSGFFSRDEIVLAAYASDLAGHHYLLGIALITTALTSFYMFRLYFLTFRGDSHVAPAIRSRMQEPGNGVLIPLYILAGLSMMAGYMGLPQFYGDMLLPADVSSDSLGNFLASVVVTTGYDVPRANESALVVLAIAAFFGGFLLAWLSYVRMTALAARFAERTSSIAGLLRNRYYIDEAYGFLVVRPLFFLSERVLARFIEERVIDGALVQGSARAVRAFASELLRPTQSGFAQAYLFFMVAGVAAMLVYLVG